MQPMPALVAARQMSESRVSIIGALMVILGPLSMSLFTPAMPQMVAYFGTTEAAVKLTLSVYFGGFAFGQLICGPLSDGFGRKPIAFSFISIYLVGTLFCLVSPSIETFILARLIQGLGAAVGVAVSRAIVRDLFVGDSSARIMNLMGLILTSGPAIAPTIGGVAMELFGWQSIFVIMLAGAVTLLLILHLWLVETVKRDLSRIRPTALIRSYGRLLSSPYFVSASLVVAGGAGTIYAQATILPFIIINRVGLTPSQFGLGMMIQSLSYFVGALIVRWLLPRFGAFRIVPVGISFFAIGSVITAICLSLYEPTFLLVMVPIGICMFGLAFITPAMFTASLAPFPAIAGAAAALTGFFQMGGGLLGGLVAAWIGDPVLAMATVIPGMGLIAIISWFYWRQLPDPDTIDG